MGEKEKCQWERENKQGGRKVTGRSRGSSSEETERISAIGKLRKTLAAFFVVFGSEDRLVSDWCIY